MRLMERALAGLEGLLGILGGICLATLMVAVVSDAGGRYFFNHPVSGVYEISELYLMVAIVFLGLAQTQRRKGHVRVELLLERLPPPVSRGLDTMYLVATACAFACIAYVSARTGLDNLSNNRWTTGVVAIPTGPSWLIVTLGSAVLVLRLLFDAASGVWGDYDHEDDSGVIVVGDDTERHNT